MTTTLANLVQGAARWAVLTADNADVLPSLGDACIQHVVTDPPYDERTTANMRTRKGEKTWGACKPIEARFKGFDRYELAARFTELAERWVVVFCALEQLGFYKAAVGEKRWMRAGIWRKANPAPQFTGDRPGQGAEGIAIMHRAGRKRWNGGGCAAVWTTNVERDVPDHPTPKPLLLMLEIIEAFTDPGDVVLDPFCGSGTTGVACLRLGRRFVGIEKDERYADLARERLEAESQCVSLASYRAGQMSLLGAGR